MKLQGSMPSEFYFNDASILLTNCIYLACWYLYGNSLRLEDENTSTCVRLLSEFVFSEYVEQ